MTESLDPRTAAFERFWSAYPPRPMDPKAAARKVFFHLLLTGESGQAITEAAARYAEAVKAEKIEAKFIPHARTWLSQRRFEDYPAPEAETAVVAHPAHPLAALRAEIGDAAWASWIAPLVLEPAQDEDGAFTIVIARTWTAAQKVSERWGERIRQILGTPVIFEKAKRSQP